MRAPSITPDPHSVSRAALLFLCLTFAINVVRAQTSYYLSADGNDANAGTSPAASWKSITKLNSVALVPGDAVLFHRGDEFHGQILLSQSGSAALPISFAAYGSSPVKPVITG
ncbi:MAG: coagulation factor 5/8 type domain-containing protein, partial [Bacteroidetes bacterium]|nr:coagulation factor 5/8 type domain-containing protein [Bacteroidota bacterium]